VSAATTKGDPKYNILAAAKARERLLADLISGPEVVDSKLLRETYP
jgi:hypothetical protein